MNKNIIQLKRALISVSNKTGIVEFALGLIKQNIEIFSTGGSARLLRNADIPVRDVSEVTGFPEMMDGRVKTLHPAIHAGILGLRDQHADVAKKNAIDWIDLVVVNLYPFSETIQNPDATWDEAIENIDIGGPALIRAAAKNMGWVGVVIDQEDYTGILMELEKTQGLCFKTRKLLAAKAFALTASYDKIIHHYIGTPLSFPRRRESIPMDPRLRGDDSICDDSLGEDSLCEIPEKLDISLEKTSELRYGENPHQAASAYRLTGQHIGILSAIKHQGKPLSYNNITDADAAYALICEFNEPACVIVKHANPCGLALSHDIHSAFQKAFQADSQSAFGGVVALNDICDIQTAESISKIFIEVLIAPEYTDEALKILSAKSNCRILELKPQKTNPLEFKFIDGGVLVQEKDIHRLNQNELQIVTSRKPTEEQVKAMLFAWPILKQMKSNAILIAKNNVTVGMGIGQVSRIDAVDIALKKADKNSEDAILASDAFFPFRDSIDRLVGSGICAIIQPGGSVRDEEVIAACNEQDIAMVFTNVRCFKH